MNKKVLVAALGVALAAPAFADSSNVVLYGRVHTAVEHTSLNNSQPGQGIKMQNVASRLGVKGAEDLGGGLSAIFAYEFAVESDGDVAAGASGITGSRHAYVGLKGGFGTFTLGQQDGGNDSVAPLYNQAQDVAYGVANNGGRLATVGGSGFNSAATPGIVVGRTQRVNNAFGYSTNVAGVKIDARHGLVGATPDSGVAPTGENSARQTEVAATYVAGKLTVGGGFQAFEYTPSQNGVTSNDRLYQLVAAYDFGVAKASVLFGQLKLNAPVGGDDKRQDYRLSTWVPFTANTGLTASYASAEQLANSNLDSKAIQVAGYYDFSKRTRAYAGVNQVAQERAGGLSDQKTRDLVIGLRHNF